MSIKPSGTIGDFDYYLGAILDGISYGYLIHKPSGARKNFQSGDLKLNQESSIKAFFGPIPSPTPNEIKVAECIERLRAATPDNDSIQIYVSRFGGGSILKYRATPKGMPDFPIAGSSGSEKFSCSEKDLKITIEKALGKNAIKSTAKDNESTVEYWTLVL